MTPDAADSNSSNASANPIIEDENHARQLRSMSEWYARHSPMTGGRGARARILGPLLTALGLVVLGYGIKEAAGDLAPAIKYVGDKLDEIKTELTRISDNLDDIVRLLKELPDKIQGIIEAEFLRQATSDAITTNCIIRGYLQNADTFDENKSEIQRQYEDLSLYISRIFAFSRKDSAAALLGTAPHVSVWCQAFTLIQSHKGKSTASVWDNPLHELIKTNYTKFLTQVVNDYREANNALCSILDYKYSFDNPSGYCATFVDGSFQLSAVPLSYDPPPTQTNCWFTYFQNTGDKPNLYTTMIYVPRNQWQWCMLTEQGEPSVLPHNWDYDPALTRAGAIKFFGELFPKEAELQKTAEIFDGIEELAVDTLRALNNDGTSPPSSRNKVHSATLT